MAAIDRLPTSHRIRLTLDSTVTFLGWMVGAWILAMVAWVLVPATLLGWTPMVVTSGSMSPLIDRGDVVLIDTDFGLPDEGSVVAFDHGDGPVIHRVVDATDDHTLITGGDANQNVDTSLVTDQELIGTGRLLVPFIGMIRVVSAGWLIAVAVLAGVAFFLWRARPGWSAVVVLLAVGVASTAVATASFGATTESSANSLTAIDLAPPTSVTASCGTIGVNNVNVGLNWTHSTTTMRTGYEIFYDGPGGGTVWTSVGTTGPSATTFDHNVTGPLLSVGTHSWMLRTNAGPWDSENSNVDQVSVTKVIAWVCAEL